ncbi:MAG: endonuclease/exonuclease/phosphatase family protein [Cyclobacteriaceae bacterium]|nr:endonuclease/exonuclease/phosphatase family protein [Cyclobacteriaceae bacterium]
MVGFKKPSFSISYKVETEIASLNSHKSLRKVPAKADNKLLMATWNLANFGLQQRQAGHLELIAHIISCFDIVALQEIADDVRDLEKLLQILGTNYDCVYSDIGGNDERGAFIYDARKVARKGMIAELVIKTNRERQIDVIVGSEKESRTFIDYNRNPYMVNFDVKGFDFTLVNVHLYWSSEFLRAAEVTALGKWAKKRSELPDFQPPSKDIILLGDFNMPSFADDDPIYKPIRKYGFKAPLHETNNAEGSNLAGDKYYDQIFFLPKHTDDSFSGKIGVFDFDNALFKSFWSKNADDKEGRQRFHQYIRYYISDHRPLWAQFNL